MISKLLDWLPQGWAIKLACAAAALLLLAAGVWKIYHSGMKAERVVQEAKAEALENEQLKDLESFNETQRIKERARSNEVTKAQNERTAKTQAAKIVGDRIGSELVGLRNDIYTLNTDASGQPASACKTAAITARAVFEQCAQRLASVAKAADGHAADAVMLESAWPK